MLLVYRHSLLVLSSHLANLSHELVLLIKDKQVYSAVNRQSIFLLFRLQSLVFLLLSFFRIHPLIYHSRADQIVKGVWKLNASWKCSSILYMPFKYFYFLRGYTRVYGTKQLFTVLLLSLNNSVLSQCKLEIKMLK